MNKIAMPSFLIFCLLLLFDLKVLSSHQWDPRALILERKEEVPLEQGWNIGYDAQWYYKIAIDPLGSIDELDQPAYRYQRILFPLAVRILSLGRAEFVPWSMLAVNLIASALGCMVLGGLLVRRGASPWLAAVFFLSLGYLLAIRMDLLEPMALAFALCGWFLYERDRFELAILFFALSGLTKEVGLVFPAALALWEASRSRWRRGAVLLLGSAAPYLVWFGVLYLWLGTTSTQAAQSSPLWIPFSGVRYMSDPVSLSLAAIWVLGPALLAGLLAAWDIVRDPRGQAGLSGLMVLAQAGLVAVMPAPTWEDPLAILRVGLGLLAAILVWLASTRPRALPFAAALWLPSGLVLFLVPGLM